MQDMKLILFSNHEMSLPLLVHTDTSCILRGMSPMRARSLAWLLEECQSQ